MSPWTVYFNFQFNIKKDNNGHLHACTSQNALTRKLIDAICFTKMYTPFIPSFFLLSHSFFTHTSLIHRMLQYIYIVSAIAGAAERTSIRYHWLAIPIHFPFALKCFPFSIKTVFLQMLVPRNPIKMRAWSSIRKHQEKRECHESTNFFPSAIDPV